MATRKNLSFAQQIAIDRWNNDYVFGGNWDPFNRATGTDCSGCVVDELDAAINGTAMSWTRHGLSTEDWRPPSMGGSADPNNGPFGTKMVNSPAQFPPDAAVKIALHHGPGGGANSHMWCQVDGLHIETNGDDGTVLYDGVNFTDQVLSVMDTSYANSWWYLPGPIVEDGTPIPGGPSSGAPAATTDTLFADVSYYQVPVDDTYPYRVLSIRSNDGTFQDTNFAHNYQWCAAACDNGALEFFIVYFYWRAGSGDVDTHIQMVEALGGPHPKMVTMIDLESGGNPAGDQSFELNAEYQRLVSWLGSDKRVIGYGNVGDLRTMWQFPGSQIDVIVAGYGSNPDSPNPSLAKLAHQYTNGAGYGGGLPEGCSPFGNCDMNSADGLSPEEFAAACGVDSAVTPPPPVVDPVPPAFVYPSVDDMVKQIWEQLFGPQGQGWPTLFGMSQGGDRGKFTVEAIADVHNYK